VIRADKNTGERQLDMLHWGLVPSWSKDPKQGHNPINARSETIDKGMFKSTFTKRRCLVPADGFYEWKKTESGKQPYLFRLRNHEPFAFAGVWEYWKREDGEPLVSFAILTTDANKAVEDVHNRMPVILPRDEYDRWLNASESDAPGLKELLRPYPAEEMTSQPVSKRVNSPRVDSAECWKPAEPPKAEESQKTLFSD
jgi:putative SOS response-associated peptidase YedK